MAPRSLGAARARSTSTPTRCRPAHRDRHRRAPRARPRWSTGRSSGRPPWEPGTTVLWLAGAAAPGVAELFAGTPFDARVLGPQLGAASALKACFAVQSKAMPALWFALTAAARALRGADECAGAAPHRRRPRRRARGRRARGPRRQGAWRWAGEMDEAADDVRRRWAARRVLRGGGGDLPADGRRRTRPTARTRGACADPPNARAAASPGCRRRRRGAVVVRVGPADEPGHRCSRQRPPRSRPPSPAATTGDGSAAGAAPSRRRLGCDVPCDHAVRRARRPLGRWVSARGRSPSRRCRTGSPRDRVAPISGR